MASARVMARRTSSPERTRNFILHPLDDERLALALDAPKAVLGKGSQVKVGVAVQNQLAQDAADGGCLLKAMARKADGAEESLGLGQRAGRLDAERKGTGRIAVFVSSSGRIQGCVFADGLPVGQAASPPGHGAAEQLFRRLAQTVRNARRTPDETLSVPVIVESGEGDTHGDVLETTDKFGLRTEIFSYMEMLAAGFGK